MTPASRRRCHATRCLLLATLSGWPSVLLGQTALTLVHNGLEREYLLSLPDGWDGQTSAPLLLSLHGGGGMADRVASDALATLASEQGYIGVFPQGYERSWNDGRASTAANMAGIDDVGFIETLIDAVADAYPVDPDRIYVTGTSNGGTMSYRLAAEMNQTPAGNRLAGIAATSANLPVELRDIVDPYLPLHVLIMVGTADPLMPFDGGTNSGQGPGVLSSAATRDYWLTELGIGTADLVSISFPDIDPTDSSTVSAELYEHAIGPDLAYYVVDGGGHSPPGGNAFLANLLNLGPVNMDIASSEEILEFFATRPLVEPLAGDFNLDGVVDAADYTVWRDGLGTTFTPSDYDAWAGNFGGTAATSYNAVPEPAASVLSLVGIPVAWLSWRSRPTWQRPDRRDGESIRNGFPGLICKRRAL